MAVKNLECQLAQAQLRRYLAGEAVATDLMEQLERHIAKCEDCQDEIAERKRSLESLKPTPRAAAYLENDDDEPRSLSIFARITNWLQSVRKPSSNQDSKSLIKPLMLSVGLAMVLIGMGYISHDPTRLFGDRLAPSNVSERPQVIASNPASNTFNKVIAPGATMAVSLPEQEKKAHAQLKTPAPTPTPTEQKPKPAPRITVKAVRPIQPRTFHRRFQRRPSNPRNSIRIYQD